MCRGKQNREDAKRGWKIDGWEVEIWETVRRIAKLDLRMRKKCLTREQTEGKITSDVRMMLLWQKMAWYDHREGRSTKKVWEWPVLSMVVIMEGWRRIKRAEGWLFFCLPLFSAGSQQVWVWTAGKQINVSFYSQTTLLHLWQPPRWRDRPMGWKMKEAKQKCTKARGQKSGGVQGH